MPSSGRTVNLDSSGSPGRFLLGDSVTRGQWAPTHRVCREEAPEKKPARIREWATRFGQGLERAIRERAVDAGAAWGETSRFP